MDRGSICVSIRKINIKAELIPGALYTQLLQTGLVSIRWMTAQSAILLSKTDESSISFESYMEQMEDALESRRFEAAQDTLLQLREAFPREKNACPMMERILSLWT